LWRLKHQKKENNKFQSITTAERTSRFTETFSTYFTRCTRLDGEFFINSFPLERHRQVNNLEQEGNDSTIWNGKGTNNNKTPKGRKVR
jgi:hypothetical protein